MLCHFLSLQLQPNAGAPLKHAQASLCSPCTKIELGSLSHCAGKECESLTRHHSWTAVIFQERGHRCQMCASKFSKTPNVKVVSCAAQHPESSYTLSICQQCFWPRLTNLFSGPDQAVASLTLLAVVYVSQSVYKWLCNCLFHN